MSRSPEIIFESKIATGWDIYVQKELQIRKVAFGETADHEAKHAVAARKRDVGVGIVTIVPGPGFLGRTTLSRPDHVAAAAAEAFGHNGTGHDMRIVSLLGYDSGSAISSAKETLKDSEEEVEAVASLVQQRGTITGSEVDWAISTVRNPEFKITAIGPVGEKRQLSARARISPIDGNYYFSKIPDLPLAA